MKNKTEITQVLSKIISKDLTIPEVNHFNFDDFKGFLDSPRKISDDQIWYGKNLNAFIENFDHIVLIGTGGSTLGAQCLVEIFATDKVPTFYYADTTNEYDIIELNKKLDLSKTGFIIASKSGTTVEVLSLFEYFYNKLIMNTSQKYPGNQFIAITESASNLDIIAKERRYYSVINTDTDLVGRYSVFSPFGTCLAFIAGVSLNNIAEGAMSCLRSADSKNNQILELTQFIFDAFESGKDKLVIVTSKKLHVFAMWIDQLIAESLGKNGKGIIPVLKGDLFNIESLTEDSIVIFLKDNETDFIEENVAMELHPHLDLTISDEIELSFEMMKWQLAVACLGVLMEINPFNQPQVEISKSFTNEFIQDLQSNDIFSNDYQITSGDCIFEFFDSINENDYVCLLNYLNQSSEVLHILNDMSNAISNKLKIHCIVNNAPSYLHSTGQLHKGGPNQGVFIQFCFTESQSNILIPRNDYTFGKLFNAQADGDLTALINLERRACRINVPEDDLLHYLEDFINQLNLS